MTTDKEKLQALLDAVTLMQDEHVAKHGHATIPITTGQANLYRIAKGIEADDS